MFSLFSRLTLSKKFFFRGESGTTSSFPSWAALFNARVWNFARFPGDSTGRKGEPVDSGWLDGLYCELPGLDMKRRVSIASCSIAEAFCWLAEVGGVAVITDFEEGIEEALKLLALLTSLPASLGASKAAGFERRGFRGERSTGGAREGPV